MTDLSQCLLCMAIKDRTGTEIFQYLPLHLSFNPGEKRLKVKTTSTLNDKSTYLNSTNCGLSQATKLPQNTLKYILYSYAANAALQVFLKPLK